MAVDSFFGAMLTQKNINGMAMHFGKNRDMPGLIRSTFFLNEY